ncbi:hypothetical protein FRX31_004992 [Thalictrum thalictroides]|uniref:Myb/SANT-like domain-containing protein n=1 Tax=Thalictrum thalictroides TaxID=46969 RepID=A0A7J6XAN0_THATH|nr:hypothetical protein FRX31_004992 [Thalictrum thalictroides]
MSSSKNTLLPFEQASEEAQADWRPAQESFMINWMKACSKAFKNKFTSLKERFKEFKKLVEAASGLGWNPVLSTIDASDIWWNEYGKAHPKMKYLKRFRGLGCPEYNDLEVIFGDTIATGHLQTTENHDFDSTDRDDSPNDVTAESPAPPNAENVESLNENASNQSKSQTQSRKRGRRELKGSDLSEAVLMLAETSHARLDARLEAKGKFTITECQDVLETMDVEIGRVTYVRVMTLLQEKVWREAFLHMSDARRKDLIESIENGDL